MSTDEKTSAQMDAATNAAATNAAAIPLPVQRLRRLQIRSVVVGVSGGLLLLIGLAFRWFPLAWAGLLVFLLALLAVFVLGLRSVLVTRRLHGR